MNQHNVASGPLTLAAAAWHSMNQHNIASGPLMLAPKGEE